MQSCLLPPATSAVRRPREECFLKISRRRRLDGAHSHRYRPATHGYHLGEPPGSRSQIAAKARGYDLSGLRARRFERDDFDRSIWCWHGSRHRAFLSRLCPPSGDAMLKLMMEYARSYTVPRCPTLLRRPDGFEMVLIC